MALKKAPHPEEAAKRPSRRTHRVPPELLDPVVDYFKPQRVILFGSRARGEATRDSDIDLLVVVDDDTPPEKLSWRMASLSDGSFSDPSPGRAAARRGAWP